MARPPSGMVQTRVTLFEARGPGHGTVSSVSARSYTASCGSARCRKCNPGVDGVEPCPRITVTADRVCCVACAVMAVSSSLVNPFPQGPGPDFAERGKKIAPAADEQREPA